MIRCISSPHSQCKVAASGALVACFTLFWSLVSYTCAYSNIQSNAMNTSNEPYFLEAMLNQTVAVGRDAVFQCILSNLKGHQVAWFHKDRHTLLALQDKVITKNHRIRVTSQASSAFYLHITDVREEDAGFYSCQVNSSPMKSQLGHLEVVVPPRFVDHLTSPSHVEVTEDSSAVSLRCVANGSPGLQIQWRREDGQPINMQSAKKEKGSALSGEFLNLTKVQRTDSGAYICIASNGIPPATSKRIFLGVTFAPMIWTPRQVISAPLGGDAVLHCILESYPAAFTYWSKVNGPEIIVSNSKYETIVTSVPNVLYKSNLKLRIRNINTADITSYSCVAKNALGETRGTVKLALDSSISPSERQQQHKQQQQIEQQQQQQQQQQQESKRINYSTDSSPSLTWKSNHEKNSTRLTTTNLNLKSSSTLTLSFSLSYHLMCLCMLQFASMFH